MLFLAKDDFLWTTSKFNDTADKIPNYPLSRACLTNPFLCFRHNLYMFGCASSISTAPPITITAALPVDLPLSLRPKIHEILSALTSHKPIKYNQNTLYSLVYLQQ